MTLSRLPRTAALRLALLCLGLACTLPSTAASPLDADVDTDAPTAVHAWLAGSPLDVSLYDRTRRRLLPIWQHEGALYVAGEPGHEYEIHLRSIAGRRVLAVTSVDGVNVVSGESAAPGQAGYVVDAGAGATIDGWRKSLGEVASFVFTTPRRSYAARTGRPDDVGVIGIAMFREASAEPAFDVPPWPEARVEGRGRASTSPHAGASADAGAGAGADAGADADGGAAAGAQARQRAATPKAGTGRRQDATAAESTTASDAGRATRSMPAPAPAPALGTGHGARRDSRVVRTAFERASATPDAVVRIYYDSRRNLLARGVIPPAPTLVRRRPDPFPAGGFVPDP